MNRDIIRRHILGKNVTLWGAWDITQESSLEEAVDFAEKLWNELLDAEVAGIDQEFDAWNARHVSIWNGEALPFDTLKPKPAGDGSVLGGWDVT